MPWALVLCLALLACGDDRASAHATPAGPGAQAARVEPVDTRSIDQGREWYESYCADCHGSGGLGDGPHASEAGRTPTDLTRIAERNGGMFIPGAVAEYIDGRRLVEAHGTRDMPSWGRRFDDRNANLQQETRLTEDTIGAIVEYLRTLQQRAGS